MAQTLKPNSKDLDAKPLLLSPLEAFARIKKVLERARINDIQKEEVVTSINAILMNTQLFGQILPFGWEKLKLDELERIVTMARICYEKPFYIV